MAKTEEWPPGGKRACPTFLQHLHQHQPRNEGRRSTLFSTPAAARAQDVFVQHLQVTYILAEIAPPDIRRYVASMKERKRQVEDARYPLFNHTRTTHRLASIESFLKSVEPLPTSTPESVRVALREERLSNLSLVSPMALKPCEELPAGTERTEWKCLNRLRTGIGRRKVLLHNGNT